MKAVPISELKPGMVLPGPLRNPRGLVLLQANVPLTERHIEALRGRGWSTVLTDDAGGGGDLLTPTTRARASLHLRQLYDALEPLARPLRRIAPEEALGRLRSSHFARDVRELGLDRLAERAVNVAASELAAATVRLAACGVRSGRASPIAQAVDSTAVAVALARRLGYHGTRMHRLVGGALLHDIGMMLLDQRCLAKEGHLEPAERARMRQHTVLGYELLRVLRPGATIANHVAYQHHERQNGAGYPRGLRGTNELPNGTERSAPTSLSHIIVDAELVAVADVFVALHARRSYRPALSLEQTIATLRRLAGGQLNRGIVQVLLALLPPQPTGVCVTMRSPRPIRAVSSMVPGVDESPRALGPPHRFAGAA